MSLDAIVWRANGLSPFPFMALIPSFFGPGEYLRPRELPFRALSVSIVPLATPDAQWSLLGADYAPPAPLQHGEILFAISHLRREEERRLIAPSHRCWRLRQSVREAYSGEQAKEGGW